MVLVKSEKHSVRRKPEVASSRKKKLIWFSLLSLATVAALVWLSSYIINLPFWQIKTVKISTTIYIAQNDLENIVETASDGYYWHLYSKHNALLYPKAIITQKVVSLDPTLDVAISSVGFKTITIDITERTPVFAWCQDDICLLTDENGFAFAVSPVASGSVYPHILFATSSPQTGIFMPFANGTGLLRKIREVVRDSLHSDIVSVSCGVAQEYRCDALLANQFVIRFDERDDPATIASHLMKFIDAYGTSISNGELQYVDTRFGNKLFYK